MDEVIRKIQGFADLPKGWDTYGSPPPNTISINLAVDLLRGLPGWAVPYAGPISGGGINLEWRGGEADVEIECWDDGEVMWVCGEDEGPLEPSFTELVLKLLKRVGW